MSRQFGLLDGPEYSEQQLEAILKPLYPPLWLMIDDPFQDFLRRRMEDKAFRILKEGESAQWLRPQILDRARELCETHLDLKFCEHKGQVFLNYNDQLAITPKKYKRRWMKRLLTFSSYNTEQNRKYWRQQPVDGFPALPRIIVGYLFVKEMTEIKIFVSYPDGKFLRTCYLMPDQSSEVFRVVAKTAQVEDIPHEDKGFAAKPKKQGKKGAQQ